MYGAAPNRSRVGSQVVRVTKSFTPVWARAGPPMRQSSARINPATSRTLRPSAISSTAQARSGRLAEAGASTSGRPGSRTATSVAGSEDWLSIHRHSLQGLLHFLHHGLGQRRVVERCRIFLTLVLRPPEELEQGVALLRVLLVAVDQQIGEGRDGIGVLAGLVGDRDAVVGGDGGLRRRRRDSFQRGLHPLAVVVAQLRGGQLVLVGVGQLHVADGSLGLLDHAGHALVALPAGARGPVHAGALPRADLPLGRDLREVVGED